MTSPTTNEQISGEGGAEPRSTPPAAPDTTATTPGSKSKIGKWLTGGLTAAILVGLGFLGGTVVAQGASTSAGSIQQGPGGTGGQGGPMSDSEGDTASGSMPTGMTSGTITGVSDGTITIKTQSGETVTISTGSNTSVTTTQQGSVSDLAVGDSIRVQGDESNGSITAQSITEGDDAATMPMGGEQGAPGQGGPGQQQNGQGGDQS
ncbi:DUF5666 domain-containing protein [Pseudoclavibacter sp. 13-3]|uniref:DUF5666 domain-containing protein n=1 Tax=Pseudoclavibacter sp. 13-3 TaxID=2901228 RepID=UPI001E363F56|nr:DUF5666 domain-containing protein [Pseudoclavibacter sp. 13-3]MCD7101415.1 DUF5666 domain-containing protein [Pseudoclavibacter sp. 13-3]